MPPQTDSATPTRLAEISADNGELIPTDRKLRVAGSVLSYNASTGHVLLADGKDSLIVDVSICIDPFKNQSWLRSGKETVMVFGYLERTESPVQLPSLPQHVPTRLNKVDARMVLRAVLVIEAPDMDLALWNRTVEGMRALGVV